MPAGPPPSTSRRRGTAFMLVASRVPQTPSSSRRPGTGGTIGSEPVATTTCSAVWRTPPTSTTPVPASRHVDLSARADVARALHRLARAQQRLGRDAGPVRALTADQLPLHHGDAQPARGQGRGAVLTRRPAAEDDHVGVAHTGSSVPACSATMYRAYQSGQFASAWPMRFSCSPCAADARRIASARSLAEADDVAAWSTRPGSRVVISWTSQPLPSGSRNETNEP